MDPTMRDPLPRRGPGSRDPSAGPLVTPFPLGMFHPAVPVVPTRQAIDSGTHRAHVGALACWIASRIGRFASVSEVEGRSRSAPVPSDSRSTQSHGPKSEARPLASHSTVFARQTIATDGHSETPTNRRQRPAPVITSYTAFGRAALSPTSRIHTRSTRSGGRRYLFMELAPFTTSRITTPQHGRRNAEWTPSAPVPA